MLAAVKKAGVIHMICHNYRRVPAVMLAKQLIDEGKLGTAVSLSRHLPAGLDRRSEGPALLAPAEGEGRLRRARRHRLALARPRPLPGRRDHRGDRGARDLRQGAAAAGQPAEEGAGHRGRCLGVDRAIRQRRDGHHRGARASRPAGRTTTRFEINGSKGSIAFNLERMNELEVYLTGDDKSVQGFHTVMVTEPHHPVLQGVVAGRAHHRLRAHLHPHGVRPARGDREEQGADAELRGRRDENQRVLAAMEKSAATKRWVTVARG